MSKNGKSPGTHSIVAKREATSREQEILNRHQVRKESANVGPRVKLNGSGDFTLEGGLNNLGLDAPLFLETFATANNDAAFLMFKQIWSLANMAKPSKAEAAVNGMMALIRGIGPRDEVEAMLALHLTAVHMATMESARRMGAAETLAQMEFAERGFLRLCRTFAMQIEALKKYRHSGEQRVTVEHVHVHQGGQAIVGSIHQGVGE